MASVVKVLSEHPQPNYLSPVCLCGKSLSAANRVGETLTTLWQKHIAELLEPQPLAKPKHEARKPHPNTMAGK